MTSRLLVLVVVLGALPTAAQVPAEARSVEQPPSAAAQASTTRARLLPRGTELPYLGGELPPGTRVVDRAEPGRHRLGLTLFLVGWAPAALTSVGLIVTSIVLFAQHITMVGLGALLAAPLIAVPFLGPVLGFLAFSFLTFLPATVISVVALGLQGVGAWLMWSAQRKTLLYLDEAPAYPLPRASTPGIDVSRVKPEGIPLVTLNF